MKIRFAPDIVKDEDGFRAVVHTIYPRDFLFHENEHTQTYPTPYPTELQAYDAAIRMAELLCKQAERWLEAMRKQLEQITMEYLNCEIPR